MNISDRKRRIEELRENARVLEVQVNRGATLLNELTDEIERAIRGLDYDFASARQPFLQHFEEYYEIRIESTMRTLRETFTSYRSEFDEYHDALEAAFGAEDLEAFSSLLSDLRGAFPEVPATELAEILKELRTAFQNQDDQRFEATLDELADRYDSTILRDRFEESKTNLLSLTEELEAIARDVEELTEELSEALENRQKEDFEECVEAIEILIDEWSSELITARLTGIETAISASDTAPVKATVGRFRDDLRALREVRDSRIEHLRNEKVHLLAEASDDSSNPHRLLEDQLQPTLLLPVRLETRFVKSNGTPSLAIRVYPDDIHIDTHEPELTDEEFEHGRVFWESLWWATHDIEDPEALRKELKRTDRDHLLSEVDLGSLPTDPIKRHTAVKERAWTRLVQRFGEGRAAWIKRRLAPSGSETLLNGPVPPASVPPIDYDAMRSAIPFRPDSWTRPPEARLLPDKWVAFVEFEGSNGQTRELTSSLVRDPLVVGPNPDPVTATGDGQESDATGIGEGPTAWMTDFEEAKAAGMAMETALPTKKDDNGNNVPVERVEELVVVGVNASMLPATTASEFHDLLEAHHYTDGLELLQTGTPTNNTEDGPAEYSTETDPLESLSVECEPTSLRSNPPAETASDGEIAAHFLAIDPASLGTSSQPHVFANVAGPDRAWQRTARQMNRALWSATWGYYVPHMLTQYGWLEETRSKSDPTDPGLFGWLESYNRHFADYVRASGPMPPLRIGKQPYGILPATRISPGDALELPDSQNSGGPVGSVALERHLTYLIAGLRTIWENETDRIPDVDSIQDGANASHELLELLGMEAGAYGYRYRESIGEDILREGLGDELSPEECSQLKKAIRKEGENTDQIVDAQRGNSTEFKEARIQRLLSRDPYTSPLRPLIGEETATLEFLLRESFNIIRLGLPETADAEWAPRHAVGDYPYLFGGTGMPESLLERLFLYATLHEYVSARLRLGDQFGRKDGPTGGSDAERGWRLVPEPEHYGIDPKRSDEGLLDLLEDTIPESLVNADKAFAEEDRYGFSKEDSYGDVLDTIKERVRDPSPKNVPLIDSQFQSFIETLESLRKHAPGSEERERLLTETLDLASSRLDAWATSIATKRLAEIRTYQESSTVTNPSLYIGAYGYVSDIEKQSGDDRSDGYIHAPSPHHATTAAVLRSGFSAFGDSTPNPAAIDLSADRVRGALELIDGVRNGTSLNELLGYRFERALHDRNLGLDQFVPAFRALAPLSAGHVEHEPGGPEPVPGPDARRDIVDGLELVRLRRHGSGGIPWGTQLGTPTVTLPTESSDEATEIRGIFEDLDELLDAVSDVLTAEGVHQLVGGNPSRAGSSLDALARGDVPPEPRVTQTPRSGAGLMHRVLVLFGEEVPSSKWTTNHRQVRAGAEPRLNAWVERLLPEPETIICLCTYEFPDLTDSEGAPIPVREAVRLSDLEVSPLDVLYGARGRESGQRSELDQRVIHHLKRIRDVPTGTQIDIQHGSVTEWATDYGPDDVLGVSSFEGLVGFDELLEVIRQIRNVTGSGRAATARDLRLPETAGEEDIDTAEIRSRRTAVRSDLVEIRDRFKILTDLQTAHESTDEITDPDRIELGPLDALADATLALERLGADQVSVEDLATRADTFVRSLDDIITDLRSLVNWTIRGKILVATTEEGVIEVDADGTTIVPGRVLLDTFIEQVEIEYWVPGDIAATKQIEIVEADGSFTFTFDSAGLTSDPVVEFPIHFRIPEADIDIERRIRITRNPKPLYLPERTSALNEFLVFFWDLQRLSVPVPGENTVMNTYAAVDRSALETAAEALTKAGSGTWSSTDEWPWDEREAVDLLLSLPDSPLPGFEGTPPQVWTVLADIITEFDLRAGEDVGTFGQSMTTEFTEQLDAYLDVLEGTVATARLGGTLNRFAADLRRLKAATDIGTEGHLVFRANILEFLRETLLRASYCGIHGSIPQSAAGRSAADQETLTRQAASIAYEIQRRLDELPSEQPTSGEGSETEADLFIQDIETLLGDSFCLLPPLSPANSAELSKAMAPDTETNLLEHDATDAQSWAQVDTWFQRAAHVRDHIGTLQTVFVYADALGQATVENSGRTRSRLRVAQLPYASDDTWVGLPAAWTGDPSGGNLSIVYHEGSRIDGTTPPVAGLFIDEWVETVPTKAETTGLAFQQETPDNCPPQSLLLGVPADENGWSLADLRDLATESINWAQIRTVDSDALGSMGQFLPALFLATNTDEDNPLGMKTPSIDLRDLIDGGIQ